jgi:site-specific recombinase XerD
MKGGAPRSRARRVSAVGAFYAYAVHFGHALHNPVDPRLSGKAHLSTPRPRLSEGQVHLLRWGADRLDGDYAERDRLLVYLMLAGLRPRQVVELDLSGVTFEQHRMTALVWQRGGGLRRTAFPDEVRDLVRAYLPVRTHRGPDSHEDRGPLLVTYRGHRLDLNKTPHDILKIAVAHARSCPDPDAPDLPARVNPDMVALSPSPFEPLREVLS